jgi:hypothetical protein
MNAANMVRRLPPDAGGPPQQIRPKRHQHGLNGRGGYTAKELLQRAEGKAT